MIPKGTSCKSTSGPLGPGSTPSCKPKKRRPLQLVPVILRAMVQSLELP